MSTVAAELTASEIESKNQRICSQLVDREIHYSVSLLVSHLNSNSEGLDSEDQETLLRLCSRQDYEEPVNDHIDDMSRDDLESAIDDQDETDDRVCSIYIAMKMSELRSALKQKLSDENGYEEFASENRIDAYESEVYEHWIVSDFMRRKLGERGECTGDILGLTIWGRTTTGQSISMDCVIRSIANNMEILHGQKYEWTT